MFRFLIAAAFILLPATLAAQGKWNGFDNKRTGWRGAVTCPLDDSATGNFYCISLACRGDGPAQFVLSIAGGDLPDDIAGTVMIDNSPAADLAFRRTDNRSFFEFTAPFRPETHGSLIAALKGGSRGTMVLNANGQTLSQPFSLRGSSRALASALKTCPPPPPAAIADPVAEEIAKVRDACDRLDGEIALTNPLTEDLDFDGDGLIDKVVLVGAIRCSASPMMFCGSAGCVQALYRQQPEGGYVRVWRSNVHGVALRGTPVLQLHLHGSACGKMGAAPCTKHFEIRDNRLVPLQ